MTSKLSRGELVAMAGGLLMGVSVFVKCYEARPQNENATLGTGADSVATNGHVQHGVCGDHTCSFWAVHNITRLLLVAGAIAPFILAWIIIREHQLSWPRGQVTMLVGLTAVALIFYHGIIDRPGEPSGEIELEIGWYGMMLGALLMVAGSMMRQSESEMVRKPPGVL
jgi:hypothetical protein